MTRCGGSIVALLVLTRTALAAPPGRTERCIASAERGQQERDRAEFVEARASFRACAADECPSLVRRDCAQWLADVDVSVPTVVLGAKDAQGNDVLGARAFIDGKSYQEEADAGRTIPLDPGPHRFRFEHPPDSPVEVTEVLHTGEHNRPIYGTFAAPKAPLVPVAPAPSPAPPTVTRVTAVSTWAYVLGGVAVVGGASFAYFGVTGLNEKSQLRAQCGDTCSDAEVQPLKVKYITADASLGLGVIAAAVSAWLFTHPGVRRASEPGPTISISPGQAGASLSVVGSF